MSAGKKGAEQSRDLATEKKKVGVEVRAATAHDPNNNEN